VVERELRVASRGRAIYRVRFWAASVMLGVFICCLRTLGAVQNSSLEGEEILSTLLFPAFGFALLIGVIATADCVSSEKREGTLGLLFLTDLKGYDVILKSRIRAILGSLLLVLLVPKLLSQFLLSLDLILTGPYFRVFHPIGDHPIAQAFLALAPSLLVDVLVISCVAASLPRNFRRLAMRR
jgi:hypothetical protein